MVFHFCDEIPLPAPRSCPIKVIVITCEKAGDPYTTTGRPDRLSIQVSVCPYIRPSVHPSAHHAFRPSVSPSIHLSASSSVCPFVHPFIYLPFRPFASWSIRESISPSVHLSVSPCPSVSQSILLFVRLSIRLFFQFV